MSDLSSPNPLASMEDFISALNMDSENLSQEEKHALKEGIIAFIKNHPHCLKEENLSSYDFPIFQVAVLLEHKVKNPAFYVPPSVLVDGLFDLREATLSPYYIEAVQAVIEHTKEGKTLSSLDNDRLRNITTLLTENALKEDCLELLPCLYKLWNDKKIIDTSEFFDVFENTSPDLKRSFQKYCYNKNPHSALAQQSSLLLDALNFKLGLSEEGIGNGSFQRFFEDVSSIWHTSPASPQSVFLKQEMGSWIEKIVSSSSFCHAFFKQLDKLSPPTSQTIKKMLAEVCSQNPMLLFYGPNNNKQTPTEFLFALGMAMDTSQRSFVLSKMVSSALFLSQDTTRQRIKTSLKLLAQNPTWCKNIACSSSQFWNNIEPTWSLMADDSYKKRQTTEFPQLAQIVKSFDPSFTTFLFIVQEIEKIPSILDKNDCALFPVPKPPFEVLIISNAEKQGKVSQAIHVSQSINDYVALKSLNLSQKPPLVPNVKKM